MTLLEPDVALTDYGLTVECAVLAWLLWRNPVSATRFWFAGFFVALAVAALLGGTAHGFFADEQSAGHVIVWSGTLLTIGLTGFFGWGAGAHMLLPNSHAVWLVRVAAAVFAVYVAVVLFVRDDFLVAVVYYLPAALFLLVVFLVTWWRERDVAFMIGAAGMLLTFVATGIQRAQLGLHATYFNHNALYHLIQAVALVCVYLGARRALRA